MNNKEKELFQQILNNKEEKHIWKKLDNGCSIGTLRYSPENVQILYTLLKSFEEQYGEVIDFKAAVEELMLYQEKGILFIYFNEYDKPVAMNGCVFNYLNETVEFKSNTNEPLKSIYFYGLSTIPSYRGKGACRALINFAIDFARHNEFDFVYARTDLIDSKSEWIMEKAGLEVCTYENLIITEWVQVTDIKGDYRLHLWKPLRPGLFLAPIGNAYFATNDTNRNVLPSEEELTRRRVCY